MAIVRTGYANFAAFPSTGAVDIIYVDLSNGNEWTWITSAYVAYTPTLVGVSLGDKSAAWFTANPGLLLAKGQIVYLDDQSGQFKKGNGVTALSALSFLGGGGSQSLQDVTDTGSTTTNVIEAAGIVTESFSTPLGYVGITEQGITVIQSDAATPLFVADKDTDTVKYKEKEIAVIEASQATGVALTFLIDSFYGTVGTPETGNITFDLTDAKRGVMNTIIHNSGTAPTLTGAHELNCSRGYSVGVLNYIFVFFDGTDINYTISQRA